MSKTSIQEITELAQFMIEQIAVRPENTEDGEVNWQFVAEDVQIEFGDKYSEDDINFAIGMIIEAAYGLEKDGYFKNDNFFDEKIPVGTTIH